MYKFHTFVTPDGSTKKDSTRVKLNEQFTIQFTVYYILHHIYVPTMEQNLVSMACSLLFTRMQCFAIDRCENYRFATLQRSLMT